MNNIFRRIIPALLSLGFVSSVMTSCIETYNAVLPTSESDVLVVEGTIISDTVSTFYLSLTMPLNYGYNIKNIDDATIQLQGNDGTHIEGKHTTDGTYLIDTPKLNENTLYKIVINYDGDTYETDEQTPFATEGLQKLDFIQQTPDDAVDILITTDVPANPSETQYYRWTFNETWEVHPEYITYLIWDDKNNRVLTKMNAYPACGWKSSNSKDIIASSSAYYSNNQIVQYKLYDIENNDRRLYVEYSTEVTQRSLRKAEYEYEKERHKISTEMGGLFTPQPSSLPTNIKCLTSSKHVLGYVGCSLNVTRYRLFIFPDQIEVIHESNCHDKITTGEREYADEHIMYSNGYKLRKYETYGGDDRAYTWTSRECVDISVYGCTTEKPSFWKGRDE